MGLITRPSCASPTATPRVSPVAVKADHLGAQAAAAAGVAQLTQFTDARTGHTGAQQDTANAQYRAVHRPWTGLRQPFSQARQQLLQVHAIPSSAKGSKLRRRVCNCASRPSSTDPAGLLRRA